MNLPAAKKFVALVFVVALVMLCLSTFTSAQTITNPTPPPATNTTTSPVTAPAPVAAPLRPQAAAATLPADMTALPTGGRVAVIRITGLIYDFTVESFKQRAQRAIDDGATVIVIELDTPGGVLTSAIQLSREIKQLPVPTVAWVHDEAFSAGTLIAAACRFIIMSPRSTMGDCAPILPGQNLSPTERAKALSPLLEEFRDSALANGYDYALFQAMCELGIELYLLEHKDTKQRKVVNPADYQWMVQGVDTPAGSAQLLIHQPAFTSPDAVNEALMGRTSRQVGTDDDRQMWVKVTQTPTLGAIVQPIHDGRTLLTLSQDRALDFGLSRGIVANDAELKALFGAGDIGRYHPTMAQGVAYWLTRPWVRAILLMIVFIGFYLEFQAPGLSLPGLVAATALVMLLGAPFLVGLAQWWHLLLFLVGFALLLVELFITPGFGLMGLAGLAAMFAALALAVVPTAGGGLPARETISELQWSALSMLAGGTVGLAMLIAALRQFNRLPVFNRLVLRDSQLATVSGNVPSGDEVETPARQANDPLHTGRSSDQVVKVGMQGVVVSELRPTGRADFAGQYIDVSSRGEWITVGTTIRVVELQGMLIIVEAAG